MDLYAFFNDVYVPTIGCSLLNRRQYEIQLRHFDRHLQRPSRLDDLCDERIQRFLTAHGDGRSPATVNKARNHLLALWRLAARKGYVSQWPDVRPVREYKRAPQSWSLAQFEKILAASQCRTGLIGELPAALWWTALLLFLYDTGLRIGAVLKTPRGAVDLEGQTVLIAAETQKDREDQLLRISQQTCEALAATWPFPRQLLFPWDRSHCLLWKHYEAILIDAGLPATRRDKFHRVRRTTYTETYRLLGQAAAMRQAGHSCDLSDHYLDRSKLDEPSAADVLPRPEVFIRSQKRLF